MKKTRLLNFMALLMCAFIFTTACDDDDDSPTSTEKNTHNDAFGDVFVKKVKSSTGDKYGLVFYAGGEGLTACKAKAPDGTEYTLVDFWKGAGNMRRHPKNNEMKSAMPETGAYEFSMTFSDGQTKTILDTLENVEIPSIKVDTVKHTAGTDIVTAEWNSVSGVGYYMVKLTDKDKNESMPIFNNKRVSASATDYTFDVTTSDVSPGWMLSEPTNGDTCYVMVVGVIYETEAEPTTYDQNKQMNTVQPKMIIW